MSPVDDSCPTDQAEHTESARPTQVGSRLSWLIRPSRTLQLGFLLVGVGLVVAAWLLGSRYSDLSDLSTVGYPGVFFLSFLGSAAMVLPVPGLISLCAVSVLLNPLALGLLAAVGETLGEISGYAVGFGGGSLVDRSRTYVRIRWWVKKRGWVVLLLVSIIPNPLFDLVGIAAGATRYPIARFLAIVLVGKIIKGLMIAYTCSYGIRALPWVN